MKNFVSMGMVAFAMLAWNVSYASPSHSDPESPESGFATTGSSYTDESEYNSGVTGDAQEQDGQPAGNSQRPAFNAANIGLDVIRPGVFGVVQLAPAGPAKVQNDGPGATAGAAMQSQSGMPMNSMVRWEHTEYAGVDSDSERMGITLRGAYDLDYFSLNIAIPIDHVQFDDEFTDFDFTRIGLVLTPRLYLLTQEERSVDLAFGMNAYYTHTWFNQGDAYDRLTPTDITSETGSDHIGIGPILTIQKDYEKFTLGFGALWQHGINMGGDEEFFDDDGNKRKQEIDVIKASLNIGVPIGDTWLVSGIASYTNILDNHGDLDEDFMTLAIGATYIISDKWTLDAMFDTDVGADDLDSRYQFSVGAVWQF